MMETPARIHPAMVGQLLRSYGMTEQEIASMSDRYLSDRMKNLLVAYRPLQMSRGTEVALREYLRVLTGYAVDVWGMENLLLTAGDASPLGKIHPTCTGRIDGTGVQANGCWVGMCPDNQALLDDVDTWFDEGVTDRWLDSWDTDLFLDYWGDWDDWVGTGAVETPAIPVGHAWRSEDSYDQQTGWVWRLKSTVGGAWFGSAPDQLFSFYQPIDSTGVWDNSWEDIFEIDVYRLRARVRGVGASADLTLRLEFRDDLGEVVSSSSVAHTADSTEFSSVEVFHTVPDGAAYVSWRVVFASADDAISLAAIELRSMGLRTSFRELEDDVYRTPRSQVVALHTPYSEATDFSVTMDDAGVAMNESSVLMDQRNEAGYGIVRAFDAILINKATHLIGDYLPETVNSRVIAGHFAEYSRKYPQYSRRGSDPPEAGRSYLLELPQ